MLAKNDLVDYITDNYGTCDRGADCYHGKDAAGRFNGCLRTGWKGKACPYWHPTKATSFEDLWPKQFEALWPK